MNLKKIRSFVFVLLLFSIVLAGISAEKIKSEDIPSAMRELRGVWVATVANIDWPTTPGLSVDVQKQQAIAILDRVKTLNMNAVVLQVRPQADAMYPSELEPWSYYLTGAQGKAPEPFYDPLKFWIDEAHARGIELHAWFNPYRAKHSVMRGEVSEKSILKTHPECVRKLGNHGYYWMDPAMKEVQDHSFAVIMDVVKRYDLDGIHFDDYFYPYPDYNDGKDFPDDETYKAYKDAGGTMERGDWRRDAVNKFVKRVYDGIKKEKPAVKFGISPFGLYRPGYPKSVVASFDQYATLYADAKLWLNEGWVDYYTPQLYWNISRIGLSYPILLGWWAKENTKGRNLWPGLYIRPETETKTMALEIVNQIMVTRGMVPEGPGTVLFSMKPLIPAESDFQTALGKGPFEKQALIPASPWLDSQAPDAPTLKAEKKEGGLKIAWKADGNEKPFLYVLYSQSKGKWNYSIFPENKFETFQKIEGKKITAVAISAVDRCGNESAKNIAIIEPTDDKE